MYRDVTQSPCEEALNKVEKLYSSPKILPIVSELVHDPAIEVNDLVELINVDAALTADIIQMSNSASYAFKIKSSNLTDAIKRIGFGMLTRLIGISITRAIAYSDLNYYQITANEYWEDSISQAIIMHALAERCGEVQADAYTIGLMNNVGKVVINDIMNNFRLENRRIEYEDMCEWERDMVGFTHAYAGSMILKRWGFPTRLCHPILYQYKEPRKSIPWPLHTCTFLAGKIIERTGVGFRNQDVFFNDLNKYLALIDMHCTDLPEIIKEARESFVIVKQSISNPTGVAY